MSAGALSSDWQIKPADRGLWSSALICDQVTRLQTKVILEREREKLWTRFYAIAQADAED